jgi:hypothetical protein
LFFQTLEIYELPKIHELQSNLHPKPKWKNLVNSTRKKYWTEKLKEETSGKTTLKFMSSDHLAIGDSNNNCLRWISASTGYAPISR